MDCRLHTGCVDRLLVDGRDEKAAAMARITVFIVYNAEDDGWKIGRGAVVCNVHNTGRMEGFYSSC